MKHQLKVTNDGSHTLWIPQLDETYHSIHGALAESQYVFIDQGLGYFCRRNHRDELRILEVGFGTGLNAWLTWIFSLQHSQRISYQGLEPFPISSSLIPALNYTDLPGLGQYSRHFEKLHAANWNCQHLLEGKFSFGKYKISVQDYQSESYFDLIFFDAFAPTKQPEMWEFSIFEKLTAYMRPGSVLVSYCAQGQFKRYLKSLGFTVERLKGPPPKREMTRAWLT